MTMRERLRPLQRAVRNFHQDGCLNHAAAVAFYTLLSLGPFIYLLGASLSRLLASSTAPEAILESIATFFPPEAYAGLTSMELEPPKGGTFLLIVIPALLWVAASAFFEFEFTLNVAFGTSKTGGALLSRLKAFALLCAGWLLLGGGLVLSTLLPRLGRLRIALGLHPTPDRLTAILSQFGVGCVSFLLFLTFYRVLSRRVMRWSSAAGGAALAFLLWEVARRVFGMVLTQSHAFGMLTGTLAGMVAFLLWIYVSVAVVLMGAELAAELNGNRAGEA